MAIRPATLADLADIRALLTAANDMPDDIGPVVEEKCFGAGFEGAPQVRVAGDLEGIAVTCGKYLRILAVRRDARRRGMGSELLRDAEARGAQVIAAEPGNYFTPGVLESMVPFFTARGYRTTARTNNLECDTGLSRAGSSAVFAARGKKRREHVLEFIAREFGPIWRFE